MAQSHPHGWWFQDQRMRRHLTQDKLAKAIGRDRTYITAIESGRRWPSEQTLYAILGALHVDPKEAVERLGLVESRDVARVLRFIEILEDVGKKVSPAQLAELQDVLGNPTSATTFLGQLAVAGGAVGGPEGWDRLTDEDRRLVKRVVGRILDGYPKERNDANQA